ncbi:MAG TPA: hypothetical protein VMR28_03190 [Candidatus Saccharimonadales bacterium]|nr:hypothetical protein [Candidatus Saccharimonadales bacterium]
MSMTSILRLTVILVAAVFIVSLLSARPALALFGQGGAQAQACAGINANGNAVCDQTVNTSLGSLIATVINILSLIVGVASIIMVIVGGFRFIISGGDSTATASARNTVIYALVGLTIAILAQVLVHFVLGRLAGI